MVTSMFAVFDKKAGIFNRPFHMVSEGAALRSFQDEVNREAQDNMIQRYPDDFALYFVGSFDDNDCKFNIPDRPQLVIEAAQLIVK